MRHRAVRDGGAVLDHDHAPAAYRRGIVEPDRRRGPHDRGARVDGARRRHGPRQLVGRSRVDLVHHDEVGGLEHGLARMVAARVVGSQGVDHDEVLILPRRK
jgi:hypothetical protein